MFACVCMCMCVRVFVCVCVGGGGLICTPGNVATVNIRFLLTLSHSLPLHDLRAPVAPFCFTFHTAGGLKA